MSNPAAPQGAPATPPAAPPAPEGGQQPPAPAATPPVPSPPPSAPAQPAAPAVPAEKTFTQADLDRILDERMTRFEKSFNQKVAQSLGFTNPDEPVDPVKALEAAQGETATYRDVAAAAVAESVALAAGIKKERVETFIAIAQASGLLKDVNVADPSAKATLRAALEAKAGEYPEWKASALPGASGGDGQGAPTPDINQRIAAAEAAGDWSTVISLKRQKARERNAG